MEWFTATLHTVESHLIIAGCMVLITATLIMLCVPGTLIPLSIASGALVHPVLATAAVVLGMTAGSQLLFLFTQRVAHERLRQRLGSKLETFEKQFHRFGLLYLVGLRVIGAPHFLVTGCGALMQIRRSTFALSTALGTFPVVALGSGLGSLLG
jgi:uncharacterized membrane protein YdjX (TVP38/TMEM64 family)